MTASRPCFTLAHASGLMAEALGCDDSSIPIIAVYVRVTETVQGIAFNVAKCAIDDGRDDAPRLHSVDAIGNRRLRLRRPGGS
jgi:hypothetical protein